MPRSDGKQANTASLHEMNAVAWNVPQIDCAYKNQQGKQQHKPAPGWN